MQKLQLRYTVDDGENLVWPEQSDLTRADNLWQSTCFELFIGDAIGSRYYEINISPSGAWNCYEFDDYRAGMTESQGWQLNKLVCQADSIEAELLTDCDQTEMRLGPSVVLERTDSTIAYYALSHGDKPDFHDSARHVLVAVNDL